MFPVSHFHDMILVAANCIHISESTQVSLEAAGGFQLQKRGKINVKVGHQQDFIIDWYTAT
jgi:hypothetical protein